MCRADGADSWPEFSTYEMRKAIKKHKCEECGRDINPGESYAYEALKFEGEFYQHKTCQHCLVPIDWLKINCGGYIFGEVCDEIKEHAEEYSKLALPLMRLVVGMKRRWRKFNGEGLMTIPQQAPGITSTM